MRNFYINRVFVVNFNKLVILTADGIIKYCKVSQDPCGKILLNIEEDDKDQVKIIVGKKTKKSIV